ncbi:eukaryotic translation initiation factor 4E, partial [Streptococcus suis]
EGIRPLWEDSANCNGGKWIIRFKKVVSGRFWEDLVLALVGDQLDFAVWRGKTRKKIQKIKKDKQILREIVH